MAKIYDAIDLYWSHEGDYAIDERGDLMDTSFDSLRSIKQEIIDRVSASRHDWRYQPAIGANIDRFVGESNTPENGKAIKHAITNALLYGRLVDSSDLRVRVTPLSMTMVAIRVELSYIVTSANTNSLPVTLNFLYDYSDNHIYATTGSYVEDAS